MKKLFSYLVVFIAFLFLMFTSAGEILAKSGGGGFSGGHGGGFGGGGRSFSSGSSFSPGPSRSGSTFTGSHTRSGSTFTGSHTASNAGKSSSYDASARVSAARDASRAKFETYKASNPSFSSRSYTAPRTERVTTYTTKYKPSGYYRYTPGTTVVYADSYNNNFMMYATMLWMFHHWDTVDKSRFESAKLKELEAEVAKMKAQGVKQDPTYVQPGVDADLMYEDDDGLGFLGWTMIILGGISVGGLITYVVIRVRKHHVGEF